MDALVSRILQHYGVEVTELLTPAKGYRNLAYPARLLDGSIVLLVLFKCEPGMLKRIKRANRISECVNARGLPARHVRDTRITQLRTTRGVRYAALYNFLPGSTIPWEAYTQKHLKLLGQTMSDVHAALIDCDTTDLPNVTEEYLETVSYMSRYFSIGVVSSALNVKLGISIDEKMFSNFKYILRICANLPCQQALHMDLVRSNILFSNVGDQLSVTGILDFEKTAYGNPIFDIARTLSFLLVDCKYKEPEKIRKYFLTSGYQKRGLANYRNIQVKHGAAKINILEQLIDLFLMYDFYKFLKHNPYEYLPYNEHFVRTRNMLLDRHLIQLHF